MARMRTIRLLLTAFVALAAFAIPAHTASAEDKGCAPGAWCFSAGNACSTFALQIQFSTVDHRVCQEFREGEDSVLHLFGAGAGNTLTFTNLSSGATLALPAGDSAIHIMLNPDGSRTEVAAGNHVIVRSPVRAALGPSTMVYMTRLVYVVTPGEIFAIRNVSDAATDICAALSD